MLSVEGIRYPLLAPVRSGGMGNGFPIHALRQEGGRRGSQGNAPRHPQHHGNCASPRHYLARLFRLFQLLRCMLRFLLATAGVHLGALDYLNRRALVDGARLQYLRQLAFECGDPVSVITRKRALDDLGPFVSWLACSWLGSASSWRSSSRIRSRSSINSPAAPTLAAPLPSTHRHDSPHDRTLHRCLQDSVNPGKKSSKFNRDCTICHSCREAVIGPVVLGQRENRLE